MENPGRRPVVAAREVSIHFSSFDKPASVSHQDKLVVAVEAVEAEELGILPSAPVQATVVVVSAMAAVTALERSKCSGIARQKSY